MPICPTIDLALITLLNHKAVGVLDNAAGSIRIEPTSTLTVTAVATILYLLDITCVKFYFVKINYYSFDNNCLVQIMKYFFAEISRKLRKLKYSA